MHDKPERPVTHMRRVLVTRLKNLRGHCVENVAAFRFIGAQSDAIEAMTLLVFAEECGIISRSQCNALWAWVRGWRVA